jgi:hypothetical protein
MCGISAFNNDEVFQNLLFYLGDFSTVIVLLFGATNSAPYNTSGLYFKQKFMSTTNVLIQLQACTAYISNMGAGLDRSPGISRSYEATSKSIKNQNK